MKTSGFSLVELIVVIAIMAILVGVAVPVYSSYIDKAQETADAEYLDSLSRAAQIFAADKGLALKSIWIAPVVTDSQGIELYLSDGSYYTGDLSDLYATVGKYDFKTIQTTTEVKYHESETETDSEGTGGCSGNHSGWESVEATCIADGYERCTACGYYKKIPAAGHTLSEVVYGNLHVTKCKNCDYVNVYFDGNLVGAGE